MTTSSASPSKPMDLRFFGFTLTHDLAEMMIAQMRKKNLTTDQYLARLIAADVVKDAEARA